MKIGQKVKFYDPEVRKVQVATVLEITGAGDSLAKVLTVEVKGEDEPVVWENVHHGTNAIEEGEQFWLAVGETPPKGWEDHEEGVAAMPIERARAVIRPKVLKDAAQRAVDSEAPSPAPGKQRRR